MHLFVKLAVQNGSHMSPAVLTLWVLKWDLLDLIASFPQEL